MGFMENKNDVCNLCAHESWDCDCFKKYYISTSFNPQIEVSKEQFMATERMCGFYSKIEGKTATYGFGMMKDGFEIKGVVKTKVRE